VEVVFDGIHSSICEAIPGISDHDIVFVDSNIAISRQKLVKRKIYMWKKADTQKLKSKIEEMSNNKVSYPDGGFCVLMANVRDDV
jgi:hypothetical protein